LGLLARFERVQEDIAFGGHIAVVVVFEIIFGFDVNVFLERGMERSLHILIQYPLRHNRLRWFPQTSDHIPINKIVIYSDFKITAI
jgi:hypothetical protein